MIYSRAKIRMHSISIDASKKMIGGFSPALSFEDQEPETSTVNNCKGGNSKAGCGAKAKKRHSKPAKGSNANCSGNCVSGCGK